LGAKSAVLPAVAGLGVDDAAAEHGACACGSHGSGGGEKLGQMAWKQFRQRQKFLKRDGIAAQDIGKEGVDGVMHSECR